MIERLRKPGGTLGTLSILSTFALALIGIAGAVAMLVSLGLNSSFWSDSRGDKAVALVFFALAIAGAYGFLVMDRTPYLGAGLGVVGGVAIAVLMFWAVLPILIGLGAAVIAVLRARVLHKGTTALPSGA